MVLIRGCKKYPKKVHVGRPCWFININIKLALKTEKNNKIRAKTALTHGPPIVFSYLSQYYTLLHYYNVYNTWYNNIYIYKKKSEGTSVV